MNVDELMEIVGAEHLGSPVLYGARRPDAVVLERDDATLKVYLTSERAWPVESTVRSFVSESEALEYVLLKLRQVERARRSLAMYPD
ncbi:MAG: hypothetical protein RI885_2116 [Actinomycetota bacterium]|jgi:hypothetical protein